MTTDEEKVTNNFRAIQSAVRKAASQTGDNAAIDAIQDSYAWKSAVAAAQAADEGYAHMKKDFTDTLGSKLHGAWVLLACSGGMVGYGGMMTMKRVPWIGGHANGLVDIFRNVFFSEF